MRQETIEESISGVVDDVTFHNEESGFTVFELNCGDEDGVITAVGLVSDIFAGEQVTLGGYWDFHASFGRQFRVLMCERHLPETAAEMLQYLSSGTVKGVGPATARKIIDRFGNSAFDVLENRPEELSKINGISADKAKTIGDSFKKQVALRQTMILLERFGMTPTECLSAFKALGGDCARMINENPYLLCSQDVGIKFERADAIAANLPAKPKDSCRVRAGIIHVVSHNLGNGHTCLPREKLIAPSSELLAQSADTIDSTIDSLIEEKQLCCEKINGRDFIFLPRIWLAEKNIAERIKVMLRFPPSGRNTLDAEIDKLENANGIKYEKNQREAISLAIQKGMLILTGGPGTGKTTTVNGILELFRRDGLDVALAAPTGRAAKRMSEITGKSAKTLHRLLEVEWDTGDRPVFSRNMQNPLDCDAIIVDELSMVDVCLFSSLLDALPLGCRLVMVGDSDQLPPVGAGNVLADLIASSLLPVVALTEVFRQAMQSLIVANAHRIVAGEMPDISKRDNDFFFMQRVSPAQAARTVVELCAVRLPDAYKYDTLHDIQVLCPSRKGESGTQNLNRLLQQVLNPPAPDKPEFKRAGTLLRKGDKVMQIKNDYDITWTKDGENGSGVYNGDIGILKQIDLRSSVMRIRFDDREALYPIENADELELAYACTVHKSQGSEFEAVVIPVCGVPAMLKYRNLLYTAVTRAKSKLIIVGTQEELAEMVYNDRKTRRYSALTYFLLSGEADGARQLEF